MNALNGLDGKSALIGGALALGGLAATTGGLLPLLLVGGLVFLVGTKQGWWGGGPRRADPDPLQHRPPDVPPFFAEWHRQVHAADAAYQTGTGLPAGYQPVTPTPAPPRQADVRIPITPADPTTVPEAAPATADDRQTVGAGAAPLA